MSHTAIVTGGSRGFGRAIAEYLVREGWHVIIDGRDAEAVNRASGLIGAQAVPGDVAEPIHRHELIDAARATGRLDLLVNNASTLGVSPLLPLRDLGLDVLEDVYRINVVAPLALIQEALPILTASDGAIVNITSDAAREGYEGWGGYGSSKAALEQLSNVLAAEEPQLRVWWLDPGDMRTQMHQDAFPGEDISDRPEPETVVPAVAVLLDRRPESGRVRASEILVSEGP
jgi:NAD(P)-dependent dehydrogenase (short-subunit alcohol dehydrogenase family)